MFLEKTSLAIVYSFQNNLFSDFDNSSEYCAYKLASSLLAFVHNLSS
jgi:hypothetical protein